MFSFSHINFRFCLRVIVLIGCCAALAVSVVIGLDVRHNDDVCLLAPFLAACNIKPKSPFITSLPSTAILSFSSILQPLSLSLRPRNGFLQPPLRASRRKHRYRNNRSWPPSREEAGHLQPPAWTHRCCWSWSNGLEHQAYVRPVDQGYGSGHRVYGRHGCNWSRSVYGKAGSEQEFPRYVDQINIMISNLKGWHG